MSHDVRDLLPCPFCGSDVEEVQKGKLLSLRCPPHSPCIGGWLLSCGDSEHRAEMHKTWNTRATLSPDPVLLGEVREALEPFSKAGSLFDNEPADPRWTVLIYRPAAGDEYNITDRHLRVARAALNGEQS